MVNKDLSPKAIKAHKKEMVLEYLESIPVYKWAAKSVMISQDTLKDWRKEDKEFDDACEAKISEFVRKTARRAKPEFQLERLLKDDFAQRTELTGKDGETLIIIKSNDHKTEQVADDSVGRSS